MGLDPIDQRTFKKSRAGVWAALKQQGRLTIKEACLSTGLGVDTVRDYFKGLAAAGYVRRVDANEGQLFSTMVYELVKPTKTAPRVRKPDAAAPGVPAIRPAVCGGGTDTGHQRHQPAELCRRGDGHLCAMT